MKVLFLALFMAPLLAFADQPPYSQGEFLSKLQNSEVTMKASPLMPMPHLMEEFYKMHKSVIPSFRRELLNYYHFSQGEWMYTIGWDWVSYRCVFGIDKKIKDPKNPNTFDRKEFLKRYPNDKPSEVGETIKKSFCEKLYGFPL